MKKDCIVFVHKSESWYLYYTVKQARFYNPDARIVLISDCAQRSLRPYAEIHDIAEYWSGAKVMEEIYEHNSPFTREYEIINFQRWFVVRDFMRRNGIERAVYVDSDVLVCADLLSDFKRLGAASLAIVGYQGPYTMFIPNVEIVSRFCDFIEHLYRNEKESLAEQYQKWREVTDDISVTDMHALHTFIERFGIETLDLSVVSEGGVYDTIVQESDGFVTRRGAKKIYWRNREAYVRRQDSVEMVRLKTIHCQGAAKGLILTLFSARDPGFVRDRLFLKARALLERASSCFAGRSGKLAKAARI